MGPTAEQIEKYLCGESLPPEEEQLYERHVSRDIELQRSFHQVHMLKRRFEALRVAFARSEDAERNIWFARSLGKEPIPLEVRSAVLEVLEELFSFSYPTGHLRDEITRRVGDPNELPDEEDAGIDMLIGEVEEPQRAMRYSLRSNSEMASLDISASEERRPRLPPGYDERRREAEDKYPKIVEYMREHHLMIYFDWRVGGSRRVPVLGRLMKQKGQPALMAALDLIDLEYRAGL